MYDLMTLSSKFNKAGARAEFEKITRQLVKAEYGKANSIDDTSGDGGIDVAYVNDNSEWIVFQCKYFEKKIGDSQKGQIRDSYKKVKKTLGNKLHKWVLCIPTDMGDDAYKWWNGWKGKTEVSDGIEIELFDGGYMQDLLDNHSKVKSKHFKSLTLRDEQISKIEVIEESHYEDKKLFKQFCKEVGNAVEFIRKHNFAVNLTEMSWLDKFDEIIDNWNRPDNRFDNEELEDLQGEFVVSLYNLKSYLSFVYFESDNGVFMRPIKKPDRKLFKEMYTNTKKYRGEVVKTYGKMNEVDKRLRKEAKNKRTK